MVLGRARGAIPRQHPCQVSPCPQDPRSLGPRLPPVRFLPPQDQFHRMVELTMAARQAYKTMLESVRQELAGEPAPPAPASPPLQGPCGSVQDGPPAPAAGKEEPHYSECWGGLSVLGLRID